MSRSAFMRRERLISHKFWWFYEQSHGPLISLRWCFRDSTMVNHQQTAIWGNMFAFDLNGVYLARWVDAGSQCLNSLDGLREIPKHVCCLRNDLGGGFKYFIFSPWNLDYWDSSRHEWDCWICTAFQLCWYCWWFRNPKQPPGMYPKPL